MDSYCKNFTGGHCQKRNMHVPRSFCFNACKHRDGIILPSKTTMAVNFSKASVKHLASGLKNRTPEQQAEVQAICKLCDQYVLINNNPRCKKCGCYLNVKQRWQTADCPLGKWPDNDLMSIMLPARNEKYLNQTIESILATATGNYEILVGLDGWTFDYEVISHPKVHIIKEPVAIGRRKMANKLAREAKGNYYIKCDAHCIFKTLGWNTKLKDVCGDNMIVSAVMDSIDETTWTPKGRKWMGWLFDSEFHTRWWTDMVAKDKWQLTEETLCFSASTCCMKKETFWRHGGNNETFGHWGNEELEWALKIQTSGGKLVCRTDVEVAHLYRTKFPYRFRSTVSRDVSVLKAEYPDSVLKPIIDHFRQIRGSVPGWDTPAFGRGAISERDWNVLKAFIKKHNIKTVTEFGSGLSTELMDGLVEIDSYETDQSWIDKTSKKTKNAAFYKWDGKTPPVLPKADMAFIDGPRGGSRREPSYISVANSSIPIVACHDSNRQQDRDWIDKYFKGWKVLAENKRATGLVILERPSNG